MNTEPIITPVGEQKSYFEKNKKMIILLLALLLIFCGLISVIFISSRPGENKAVTGSIIKDTDTPDIKPIASEPVVTTPTPTPISTYNPVLPEGWTYQTSADCGVKMALPPATGQYYAETDTTYSKWIYINNDTGTSTYPFKKGGLELYADFLKSSDAQLGNDSNGNNFHVTCEQTEMTNDQVKATFEAYYNQNETLDTITFGDVISKWGVDAQVTNFNSAHFGVTTQYLVRKNGRTYLISYTSTNNDQVANQISDSLVFE